MCSRLVLSHQFGPIITSAHIILVYSTPNAQSWKIKHDTILFEHLDIDLDNHSIDVAVFTVIKAVTNNNNVNKNTDLPEEENWCLVERNTKRNDDDKFHQHANH